MAQLSGAKRYHEATFDVENGGSHADPTGRPTSKRARRDNGPQYSQGDPSSQSQSAESGQPLSQIPNGSQLSNSLTQSQGPSQIQHTQVSQSNIPRAPRENRAAENGIIEEVFCTNFMCHVRLEVKLGPLINFIIGHNGSGKSAVLTALTLCLGGKATSTNRGSNLKSFIKEGEEHSVVSVKIKNQGEGSFKPELYGPSIIVERHFSRSGTSGFKLKSALGKIISTKRADLEDITDAFALQLDNPMMVLTQDMAREFLNNSTPQDKYKFFYKGTQLETLDRDYSLMEEILDAIEDKLRMKDEDIDILVREHAEAARKAQLAEQHQSIADQLKTLGYQMAWAQVEEQESQTSKIERKIAKIDERIAQVDESVEAAEAELDQQETEVKKAQGTLKEAKESQNEPKLELEKLADEIRLVRQELAAAVQEERDMRSEYQAAKRNEAAMKQKIADEQAKIERMDGGTYAKKQEYFAEAKVQLAEAQANLARHTSARNALDDNVREKDQAKNRIEEQLNNKKDEIRAKERYVHSLRQESGRWIEAYPKGLTQLLRAIESDRGFQTKPVGPIGRHVRLMEGKWMSVLERSFGNVLNSFVVTSREDQRRLDRLMQQAGYPRSIYIGNPTPIDTRRHEPHPEIVTTMRVLQIDNVLVRNQLIIGQAIEQTALAETIADGGDLIKQRPSHVRRCFALNTNTRGAGVTIQVSGSGATNYTPIAPWKNAPRMQMDTERQVELAASELQLLRGECSELQSSLEDAKQAMMEARRSIMAHSDDSRRLKGEIDRIQHRIDQLDDELEEDKPVTGQVDRLEVHLRETKEEIRTLEAAFASHGERKESLNEQMNTLRIKEKDREAAVSKFESFINKCVMQERRAIEKRHRIFSEKTQLLERRQEIMNRKEVTKNEKTEQDDVVKEFVELASNICPRIPVPEGETSVSLDKKMMRLREDRERFERELGGSVEDLLGQLLEAQTRLETARSQTENLEMTAHALKQALLVRRERWTRFRQHISIRARVQFRNKLHQRKFRGRMLIDHDRQELDIKVEPDFNKVSGGGRQAKTLSGGEKSFATICLLLALWDAMGSTIRCLDEFDVFMDSVNRSISMNMMIDAARESVSRQFVLISPQAMGNVEMRNDVRIIKMRDPERGQTALSFAR